MKQRGIFVISILDILLISLNIFPHLNSFIPQKKLTLLLPKQPCCYNMYYNVICYVNKSRSVWWLAPVSRCDNRNSLQQYRCPTLLIKHKHRTHFIVLSRLHYLLQIIRKNKYFQSNGVNLVNGCNPQKINDTQGWELIVQFLLCGRSWNKFGNISRYLHPLQGESL